MSPLTPEDQQLTDEQQRTNATAGTVPPGLEQENARRADLDGRRQRLTEAKAALAAEGEKLAAEEKSLLESPIYDTDERTVLSHVRDAVQHYLSFTHPVSQKAQQVLEMFLRNSLNRMRELDTNPSTSPVESAESAESIEYADPSEPFVESTAPNVPPPATPAYPRTVKGKIVANPGPGPAPFKA